MFGYVKRHGKKCVYLCKTAHVEKKYGFKVHTAYIVEVKRTFGMTMYDTPNTVEELEQPRKHLPKEKVEAIKDAFYFIDRYSFDIKVMIQQQ